MNNLAHDIFPPSDFSEITLLRSEGSAIELHFNSFDPLDLAEIRFRPPGSLKVTRTYRRGKFGDATTFSWTVAVRALVYLLVRQRIATLRGEGPYRLIGGAASFAAALDYAITKQPRWLKCVFGESSDGVSYARRVFRRINSERKRGGEVVVIPEAVLGSVFLKGTPIDSIEELEQLAWATSGSPRTPEKLAAHGKSLLPRSRQLRNTGSKVAKTLTPRDVELALDENYFNIWRASPDFYSALLRCQTQYENQLRGRLLPIEKHVDIVIYNERGDARITQNLIAANVTHSTIGFARERIAQENPAQAYSLYCYEQDNGLELPWESLADTPCYKEVSIRFPEGVPPLRSVAYAFEYTVQEVFKYSSYWISLVQPGLVRNSISVRAYHASRFKEIRTTTESPDGMIMLNSPEIITHASEISPQLSWEMLYQKPQTMTKTFWKC